MSTETRKTESMAPGINQTESMVGVQNGQAAFVEAKRIGAFELRDIADRFERCLNGGHDGSPSCQLVGVVSAAAVAVSRQFFRLRQNAAISEALRDAERLQNGGKPMGAAEKFVKAAEDSEAFAKQCREEGNEGQTSEDKTIDGNEKYYLQIAASARERAAGLYSSNARVWANLGATDEAGRLYKAAIENADSAAGIYWRVGDVKGEARTIVAMGVMLLKAGESATEIGTLYGEWLANVNERYYSGDNIPKAFECFAEEVLKIGQRELSRRAFGLAAEAYGAVAESAYEAREVLMAEEEDGGTIDQERFGELVENEARALESQADALVKLGDFNSALAKLATAREYFIARRFYSEWNVDGTRKTTVDTNNFDRVVKLFSKEAAVLYQSGNYHAALDANDRAIGYLNDLIGILGREGTQPEKIIIYEKTVRELGEKKKLLLMEAASVDATGSQPDDLGEIQRYARDLVVTGSPKTLERLVEIIADRLGRDKGAIEFEIVRGGLPEMGFERISGFREAVSVLDRAGREGVDIERRGSEEFWKKFEEVTGRKGK